MKKTRILICDDHSLMRFGLRTLFSHQPDMTVCGEAEDGMTALECTERLSPDVILMDLMMPGIDGAEATRLIKEAHPEIKIIVITSYSTSEDLLRAISNGASGAMIKSAPIEDIVDAVRRVEQGKESFPDEISRLIREVNGLSGLTQRQIEILSAAARGLTNQAIATTLNISPSGVNKHLMSAYQKLGVNSRSEAVAIALRKQLLKI